MWLEDAIMHASGVPGTVMFGVRYSVFGVRCSVLKNIEYRTPNIELRIKCKWLNIISFSAVVGEFESVITLLVAGTPTTAKNLRVQRMVV